jgi:Ser/Thr protein kinase RdoA (MazF antagonist)
VPRRELVGEGRTAEVLAWDDGQVIKLYRAGFSRKDAAFEARVTARIHEAGIAAPAVLLAETPDGLFEEDDRFGVVFERVRGPSMLRELAAHPFRLWRYSREFAALHADMHATTIPQLPSQRDGLLRAIDRGAAAVGRPELAERAKGQLAALPDGDVVCHGDFHPDNVILSERGPIVIDWIPASRGSGAADVARTVLLAKYGGYPPGTPRRARVVIGVFRRLFLRLYLKEYLQTTATAWSDVEEWLGVVAVARLAERIPGEAAPLAQAADRYLAHRVDCRRPEQ